MKIPSFVLRKLYVKGTLANEGDGVRFRLKNTLATSTLTELRALKLDGKAVDPGKVRVRLDGKEEDLSRVTEAQPFIFPRNAEAEILVGGVEAAGRIKVRLEALSSEFGELNIEFDDDVGA